MSGFENFISSLNLDTEEKYNEFKNSNGVGAPEILKISSASKKSFDYSINFSVNLLKQYHQWLTKNFNIQPK